MSTQASNTTANYHLSQWAESDRILMADFNADNAAIDAALKANADSITETAAELTSQIAWVKLLESTASAGGSSVTVSLGGIDMTAYAELRLEVWAAGSITNYPSLFLRFNGSGSEARIISLGGDQTTRRGIFEILETREGALRINPKYAEDSAGSAVSVPGVTIGGLQSLQFYEKDINNTAISTPAGLRVKLYGLKA